MRIAAIAFLAALLVTVAACAPQPSDTAAYDIGSGGAAREALQSGNRLRAITHRFTLRLPARETEAIQQRHLAECVKLGCTVLSTRIDRQHEGRVNAHTSVRITPQAYTGFASTLAAPPATVTSHSQSAEDKTIPVLDTEKRLEVKLALRDRLTAMLRDASTKTTADLLAIEKEIAQAQGDIESLTAQRDYLRTQTDTILVDISYVGLAAQAGGIDLSPIQQSINGLGRTMVSSVAWLISFLAATIPWIPVIALLGWIVRRGVRRWRTRKVSTAPQ